MNSRTPTVSEVQRRLLVIALTALAVAGCSQESTTETTIATGPGVTESVPGTTGTTQEQTTTTAPSGGPTTTVSDRPLAPDFTLELGDGGAYTLSEGARPVYLVFWAEW